MKKSSRPTVGFNVTETKRVTFHFNAKSAICSSAGQKIKNYFNSPFEKQIPVSE